MSWNRSRSELPFLPGYTFQDPTKSAFHRAQTLTYRNGFGLARRPTVGIGQDPLLSEELMLQELSALDAELPHFTPGSPDKDLAEDFIPAHVALDKKVLRFYAYFREDVLYSPDETNRVRPVVIHYFLEDDSICIIEPEVANSGMPQGTRLKRQRLPKNQLGEYYTWKDLNLGVDLETYGVKYRITRCDAFTKEFMESEGMVVNDPEPMPEDPYIKHRQQPPSHYTKPPESNPSRQFLTMDRKVLRFFAVWDDSDCLYGDTKPVIIHYYLADDTVEVREVHEANSGRDPFPILMRRQRPVKTFKTGIFASCVLEVTKDEVDEYYSPGDFQVGQTMTLLGRRLLLCNCDNFTKDYFRRNHPDMELKPIVIPKDDTHQDTEIPPYNGFGTLEDTLHNCFRLIPTPPKKNVLKMLENDHKVLRYVATLDSPYPEDEGRRFVLSYFLSNDTISVFEKPSSNSGFIGGKFLEKTRVPKPNSTVDNPDFYSPADFAIGATVEVFGHRFVLTDADLYVLKHLEANSSQIPSHTLESLRQSLGTETTSDHPGIKPAESSL